MFQNIKPRHAAESVALVTIGQAPRTDLTARIESIIPDSIRVRQVGLLDGLSHADVERKYALRGGDMPLVTRMQDGRVVSISSRRTRDELQLLVDRLTGEGVGVIVLLCTGQFPDLRTGSSLLIQPDVIVPAVLSALMRDSRVGVILPAQAQLGSEPLKWGGFDQTPVYAAASPYSDDALVLEAAGRELVSSGARVIVLDCMGYGGEHEEILRKVVDVPVVVSNKVVAGVLTSLF